MDVTSPPPAPVLYVIICGSPAASGVVDFIREVHAQGWIVCAVPTPMGARFVDVDELERVTGYPVRTTYKHPDEPDALPPADAFVVAPATFNTVNKVAHGITDTLAVGLVCEGIGAGRQVVMAPWINRALAGAGPYRRALDLLSEDGVQLVLTDGTAPGGGPMDEQGHAFPWEDVAHMLQVSSREVTSR